MKKILPLLLFPSIAFSQTVDQKIISARSLLDDSIITTVTAQMEGVNPTTGVRALFGAKKLISSPNGQVNFRNDSVILIDLVAPKTSSIPVIVTGLKMTFVVVGIPNVDLEPIIAHPKLLTSINMPLGATLGCRYDMPRPTFNYSDVAAAGAKWLITHTDFVLPLISVPGNIRCTVGLAANLIPAPVVTPIPVTPPASVVVTQSPAGSTAPPLDKLIDKNGAVWTIAGNIVFKDAVNINSPYDDVNSISINSSGIVVLASPTHGFTCLIDTVWSGSC